MEIPHYGFPTTYHKTFEEMMKLEDKVSDCDWLISVDADLYVWEEIKYLHYILCNDEINLTVRIG